MNEFATEKSMPYLSKLKLFPKDINREVPLFQLVNALLSEHLRRKSPFHMHNSKMPALKRFLSLRAAHNIHPAEGSWQRRYKQLPKVLRCIADQIFVLVKLGRCGHRAQTRDFLRIDCLSDKHVATSLRPHSTWCGYSLHCPAFKLHACTQCANLQIAFAKSLPDCSIPNCSFTGFSKTVSPKC